MQLGVYAPYYYPFEGGAERVARRVAHELATRHTVTVYTLRYQDELPQLETDRRVQIQRASMQQSRPLGLTRLRSPALLESLKQAPIELLHIHGVTFPNLALSVCQLARRRGIPVILVPHGLFEAYHGDPRDRSPRRLFYLLAVRTLLAALVWSAAHIALTSPEELQILRRFGLPTFRTTIVYNGFEPPAPAQASAARFRQQYGLQQAQLILHVASIKPNKGHDQMINALGPLLREFPTLTYLAAGKTDGLWGSYAAQIQQLAQQAGIAEHVRFLGHISDAELADAYAAADIVVLPSLAETFPLSVLDAMAWAKPVIATRVGGVAHMISHEQNGLLIEAGQPAALQTALGSLLRNPARREQLGAQARAAVLRQFTWEHVIERYERIGLQLCSIARM